MNKLISIIFVCFSLVPKNDAAETKSKQPNFVFILTDDQRYDLLGCTGNELIKTPHIDQLAKQGMLFTNAHVTSAICTPSRVSMFLSQYERKHGVNFNSGTSISDKAWEQSYPMVMRKNGYYTGYIGKNHAPIGDGGYESGVIENSFDYWYADHKHLYFYPKDRHPIFRGAKQDTQVEIMNEGVQDFFSNEYRLEGAKHFLANRPANQPFCLNICFNLPHDSSAETMKSLPSDSSIYRTLYRDLEIPLPENYVAKDQINNPKLPNSIFFSKERQGTYNYVDSAAKLKERIIRQMQAVTGIDGLVGNLREALKANGVDENTIIIFTSDHGLFWGEFGIGGKALCYETCTHVPLIIYNPMLPEKAKSKTCNELVQSIDLAATMLAYANIKIPNTFQGKSLKPILEGGNDTVREYLFTENLWSTQFGNPRCDAVQDKEWKYIRYYKNENLRASAKIAVAKLLGIKESDILYAQHDPDIATYRTYVEAPLKGEKPVFEELYHLEIDPGEITNLAYQDKYKDKLVELRKVWKVKVTCARGEGAPEVLRYTKDSQLESKLVIPE